VAGKDRAPKQHASHLQPSAPPLTSPANARRTSAALKPPRLHAQLFESANERHGHPPRGQTRRVGHSVPWAASPSPGTRPEATGASCRNRLPVPRWNQTFLRRYVSRLRGFGQGTAGADAVTPRGTPSPAFWHPRTWLLTPSPERPRAVVRLQ